MPRRNRSVARSNAAFHGASKVCVIILINGWLLLHADTPCWRLVCVFSKLSLDRTKNTHSTYSATKYSVLLRLNESAIYFKIWPNSVYFRVVSGLVRSMNAVNCIHNFKIAIRWSGLQVRCSQHTRGRIKSDNDIIVRTSNAEYDWRILRGIFAKAFQRYPLFKYFVPDASKRPEFTKRYFDALHDVTVRNSNALLFCFNQRNSRVVLGGAISERVSFKGDSWTTPSDEKFTEAYDRFGLRQVDNEATEKLIKYEEWESANILNKIRKTGIPIWHTMFIGIDPTAWCSGCGLKGFDASINVCNKLQENERMLEKERRIESFMNSQRRVTTNQSIVCEKFDVSSDSQQLATNYKTCSLSHGVATRAIPCGDTNNINIDLDADITNSNSLLFMGTSHCERAVKFHSRNGMRPLAKLTYTPENGFPFHVYVLMADVFNSGRVPIFRKILDTNEDANLALSDTTHVDAE